MGTGALVLPGEKGACGSQISDLTLEWAAFDSPFCPLHYDMESAGVQKKVWVLIGVLPREFFCGEGEEITLI